MLRERNRSIIISYLTLRKLIGITGILLPFICVLGGLAEGTAVKDSVSAYYHSNMRDVLTGLLVCMAVFLLTYKGYELIDNLVSGLAGIAALGIALFPCTLPYAAPDERFGIFRLQSEISGSIHLICAVSFFIILSLNSIFLFSLGKNRKRNMVYRISGIIMLAALVVTGILMGVLSDQQLQSGRVILIAEIIMLAAFGTAWLVKGKALAGASG